MTLLPNTNVVYGAQFNTSSDGFTFYGTTPTAAACSSLCEKDNNCIAFTWHDWLQPSGDRQWDGQCYGVDSGHAVSQHAQTHHVSGLKTSIPSFIASGWVAHNIKAPSEMTGLRINNTRAIRARWPNADPEYDLFPKGWVSGGRYRRPRTFPAAEDVVVHSPNRSSEGPCQSSSGYCYYTTGIGGACSGLGFEPASGYWCSADPPRGASYSTKFPSGLDFQDVTATMNPWHHWKPNETVVNAFREGHWFSYVFLIDNYTVSDNGGGVSCA